MIYKLFQSIKKEENFKNLFLRSKYSIGTKTWKTHAHKKSPPCEYNKITYVIY